MCGTMQADQQIFWQNFSNRLSPDRTTECVESHSVAGVRRSSCQGPARPDDFGPLRGGLLFASTKLDQAAERSQKHNDIAAEAAHAEIDTRQAQRETAEQ